MSEAILYNAQGKEAGKKQLPKDLFDQKVSPHLLHEAVVATMANARQAIAHTKTKGEVRGGGAKPWKQKGTGRARQGSIRSPHWKGGGVTFGPRKNRNYSKKMNTSARKAALLGALSAKAADHSILLVDRMDSSSGKTKELAQFLKALKLTRNVLIVLDKSDTMTRRASNNLPFVRINTADNLKTADILWARKIVTTDGAINQMQSAYSKA